MRKIAIVFLVVVSGGFSIYGVLNLGDGYIEVTGTVWEWTDAPAEVTSSVCWEGELPPGAKLVPLEGASVTLFHCRDHAKVAIDETDIWREDAVTARDGLFIVAGTTNPSPVHAVLRVTKHGYQPLQEMFLHPPRPKSEVAGFAHRATVILVRER